MRLAKRSHRRLALVASLGLLVAGFAGAQQFGGADFTRYVALGDSLGAGFLSGGLVDQVQEHSYPALIYKQTHGGSLDGFALPTVSAPGLPPTLQLVGLSPLRIVPAAGVGQPTNLFFPGFYGNLSVPGADMGDVLATRAGGLHDLILRGFGTQLELAAAQQPTFASLWVNNDVLPAAVSGMVINDVTLTTREVFEPQFRAIVATLSGSGATLALGTIVDPRLTPFVNTIPPILIDPATNQPVLVAGAPVPLFGPRGPLTLGEDFVLLSATAELAAGFGLPPELGGRGPLSDAAVLDSVELAPLGRRLEDFNDLIRQVAEDSNAALVDMNAVVARAVTEGITVGGVEFSGDLVTGGLFSLDGIHPTPFGYAFLANEWIRAINETYNADIPAINLAPYMFGPYAGLGTGFPVIPGESRPLVFTPKAYRQLAEALGIPSRAELRRLKARRENR